jgi:hypothetical protein
MPQEKIVVNFFSSGKFTAIISIVYFLCLLPVAIFAFKRPYYNWDMLPYMALVLKMDNGDSVTVHKMTFSIAKKDIPAAEYAQLIEGGYRKRMAESPADFYTQLPFYVVKPFYTWVVYFFYKTGFSLPMSTVLPSILSYLLIGLLLFHWLRKYLNINFALPAALLIMYSFFMVSMARISTPDPLSSLFLFSAMYFIIEKSSLTGMFLLFWLSILTRIDNLVTCLFILSFLAFTGKWQKRIPVKLYVLMVFIFISSYITIAYTTRMNGWHLLYYPTFVRYYDLGHHVKDHFSLFSYLQLIYSRAATAMAYTHFTLFAFFVLLSLIKPLPVRLHNISFDQLFSLLLIFIIIIRFILFPDLDDRFYTSFYLVFILLFVKRYTELVFIPSRE